MTDSRKQLVGQQLGDYLLTSTLAKGGMALIFKALDVRLDREVAVKVLMPEQVESDPTLAQRFEREARAVAHLEHPNIIPIYRYGEQDGLHYLAMKLVEGENLADELRRLQHQKELMDAKRMLLILEQVAAALDHAHQNGIIHRDIKPSNILIDNGEKVLLTDFGLVLRVETDKTMGTAFGTPRYISPEQALASEKAVPQSDVYSLAVIIFEILTGSMVFKAETAMQVALAHISEPPPAPSTINPNISKAVEREVLKALEKKPEKRHESAGQFIAALRAAYGDDLDDTRSKLPENSQTDTPVMQPEQVAAVKQAAAAHTPSSFKPRKSFSEDDIQTIPSKASRLGLGNPSKARSSLVALIGLVIIAVAIVILVILAERSANEEDPATPTVAVVAAEPSATPSELPPSETPEPTTSLPLVIELTEETTPAAETTTDVIPVMVVEGTEEATPEVTLTVTASPTRRPTRTPRPTNTATPTTSPTVTASRTPRTNMSGDIAITETVSPSPSLSASPTRRPTRTPRPTSTATSTPSSTVTPSPTSTDTATATPSATPSRTPSPAPTLEVTEESTPEVAGEQVLSLFYAFNVLALRHDGSVPVDVAELVLSREDGTNPVSGDNITGEVIAPGECVVMLSRSQPVDVPDEWECDTIRNRILLEPTALFWRATLNSTHFEVEGAVEPTRCTALRRGGEGQCEVLWDSLAESDG